LGGDKVSSIISNAREEADDGHQEELIENQSPDKDGRPWREWR